MLMVDHTHPFFAHPVTKVMSQKVAAKPRPRSVSKDKGLRHFSKIVCDKVEARKVTTYNEVADELVAEFNRSSNQPVDSVCALV